MTESMNILLLSCGTRNKTVQYFKDELAGRGLVIGADSDALAPALYDADRHVVVPRLQEEGYIEAILSICRDYQVKAVISWLDPEVSILAEHKDRFLELGALPIIGDRDAVEMCFDKYAFYQFLKKNGFTAIRTFPSKELFYQSLEKKEIDFPVFVKPVRASGSLNANKADTREDIEFFFSRHDDLIIQEFIESKRYDADLYVDMVSGELVSVFIKESMRMRAGQSDKSLSVKDEGMLRLLSDFVKTAGLRGILNIEVFKVKDEYYILEVNPRMGTAYPHAHEAGINIPRMIINNIQGKANESTVGEYEAGTYMLKYYDLKFFTAQDVAM